MSTFEKMEEAMAMAAEHVASCESALEHAKLKLREEGEADETLALTLHHDRMPDADAIDEAWSAWRVEQQRLLAEASAAVDEHLRCELQVERMAAKLAAAEAIVRDAAARLDAMTREDICD